jgi:predicted metal-binding protein
MNLKKHLFICTYNRESGESCGQKGSNEMVDELKKYNKSLNRKDLKVTRSGCLGLCEKGVVAVCYPEGKWFEGLSIKDTQTLKEELN